MPVLLIDDAHAQVLEVHMLPYHGMRAHQDVNGPAGQALQNAAPLLGLGAAGQQGCLWLLARLSAP